MEIVATKSYDASANGTFAKGDTASSGWQIRVQEAAGIKAGNHTSLVDMFVR